MRSQPSCASRDPVVEAVNRALGPTHAVGDFPRCKACHMTQDDHFALLFWEGGECFANRHRSVEVCTPSCVGIEHGLRRREAICPKVIDRHVASEADIAIDVVRVARIQESQRLGIAFLGTGYGESSLFASLGRLVERQPAREADRPWRSSPQSSLRVGVSPRSRGRSMTGLAHCSVQPAERMRRCRALIRGPGILTHLSREHLGQSLPKEE